jgi:TolA-binding protein
MLTAQKLKRHGSFNMSATRKSSIFLIALGLIGAVSTFPERAHAQFIPRGTNASRATRDYVLNRPTVSPYLNLLRAGTGYDANYQTLVRPALQNRQQARQQQSSINQLQSRVTNMQGQMVSERRQQGSRFSTGHPTRFMVYLHYFPPFPGRRR